MARNDPGLLKKTVTTIGGVSLIVFGIIGLFLPVLQGIVLIVGGVGLLSVSNERVRNWIARVKKRHSDKGFGFKRIKKKISLRKKPFHSYGNTGLEKRANNER